MAEQDELAMDAETQEIAIGENLPQEVTESYGTGVHPQMEPNTGEETMPAQLAEYTITTPGLTAADEDAIWGELGIEDQVGGSPQLTGGISMPLGNRQQQ